MKYVVFDAVYSLESDLNLMRPNVNLGMSSAAYAKVQGASKATVDMFNDLQTASPGMNYGQVQSAATSSEFVSRVLVKQKKKFAKK